MSSNRVEPAGPGMEKPASGPAIPQFAQVMGHPRPLWMLFMTEFWERFAFYGMRWALTLYIVAQFFQGDASGEKPASELYGAYLALVALAVVSAACALLGRVWLGWGWDFLANDALPVAVTMAFGGLLNRTLPPHLFIYIIGNAFFAAFLAMLASVLAKGAMTHALGGEAMPYFIAAIPMSFGEAFFTGGTMALIVTYRPQWCASFDDARYLSRRD